MALGRSTNLAYILAGANFGAEIYIYNLKNLLPTSRNAEIPVINLTENTDLCANLIENYQKLNEEIMLCVSGDNLEKLQNLEIKKVSDFLPEAPILSKIDLSEIDFVIQRSEPMKFPFPPAGKKNINQFLSQIKGFFPNFTFNCPINLNDKEIPQEVDRILGKNISTPTAEFNFKDNNLAAALVKISQEYQKIYQNKAVKLVIKPKDSAQSLGVFSIEFNDNGFDLEGLNSQETSELYAIQSYKIKNDLSPKELEKIIKTLCHAQGVKNCQNIKDLTKNQLIKNLYGDIILLQPFIEGVALGDIRVNLLKNEKGNFYIAGQTFRQSTHRKDQKFTTSYSSGGATSQPISIITKDEQKNLLLGINSVLEVLNRNLKQKYHDSLELGADFMLVGNGKDVLLGEINHHCQALIPISEAMAKAVDKDAFYESGLGLVTKAIKDWMALQNKAI